MSGHIKGCDCGAGAPQSVIDRAREVNQRVADGTYRALDLAKLSDEDFQRWLGDKAALGEFDGYTISGLPKHKLRLALYGLPASAIEAQRAETAKQGSVEDESAVAKPDARTSYPNPPRRDPDG